MKKQLPLNLFQGRHGGRRPNSGRKRKYSRGVDHGKRELVKSSTPLHINFKFKLFLRTLTFRDLLERAIENSSMFEFSVRVYAIESNHIHLIAETSSNLNLERGMRSLLQTLVKSLGKGRIQIERYHLHVLKTPQETKNALTYVLNNHLKHTGQENQDYVEIIGKPSSWLLVQAL